MSLCLAQAIFLWKMYVEVIVIALKSLIYKGFF